MTHQPQSHGATLSRLFTASLRRTSLLGALLLAVGCAPLQQAPAPTYPPSNGPYKSTTGPSSSSSSSSSQSSKGSSSSSASPATSGVIRPGSGSHDPAPSQRATAGLLTNGWDHYEAGRYDASISVAERALRIDRREAEIYLLLARNYQAQREYNQAAQFARQGLGMSARGTQMRRRLEDVLDEIEN